jgi:hypothetical protein
MPTRFPEGEAAEEGSESATELPPTSVFSGSGSLTDSDDVAASAGLPASDALDDSNGLHSSAKPSPSPPGLATKGYSPSLVFSPSSVIGRSSGHEGSHIPDNSNGITPSAKPNPSLPRLATKADSPSQLFLRSGVLGDSLGNAESEVVAASDCHSPSPSFRVPDPERSTRLFTQDYRAALRSRSGLLLSFWNMMFLIHWF